MTSRERVLKAIAHKEPDRVPLDLGSTQVTGISVIAYKNLRTHLGMPERKMRVCDTIQQIASPDEDILVRFGVDTRGLWPIIYSNARIEEEEQGEHLIHTNEWGLGYRRHKTGGLWYDLYRSPLAGVTLSETMIRHYPWPGGGRKERVAGLRQRALTFRRAGYAVVLKSVCAGLLEMAIRLRGMEEFLIDLLIDKRNAGHILDRILKVKMDYWETALAGLADVVDVIAEGDDFGTQVSSLISAATFREMIKPRQAELIAHMRRRAPGCAVFFHSCGSVRELLPDFIEMGIEILNPVHITAAGMAPVDLKREFGRDLVFWGGGVDTQGILPGGTPAQVRDHVRCNIEALAPGGGFVFNTVHNIQADVPPANIVAMYEALAEYGRYGSENVD